MSSGRSSTSQATNQQDNRRVIGEGGISAEGSNVSYSVTHNTLDGDVINRAFDFGGSTLDLANDVLAGALGFGGSAMRMISDANADALAFADANAARNSQMAYNAMGDALGVGTDALTRAFAFGGNVLGQGFDMIGSTNNLVKDAYADAKGRGALTDKMIMAAIVAMAVVAFMAVKK